MWASAGGYTETAQELLKAGADKGITDIRGRTALEIAQRKGHLIIEALLLGGESCASVS